MNQVDDMSTIGYYFLEKKMGISIQKREKAMKKALQKTLERITINQK